MLQSVEPVGLCWISFCVFLWFFLTSLNTLYVIRLVILYFCVLFGSYLVVGTSAIDCLERLAPKMTYCVICVSCQVDIKLYLLFTIDSTGLHGWLQSLDSAHQSSVSNCLGGSWQWRTHTPLNDSYFVTTWNNFFAFLCFQYLFDFLCSLDFTGLLSESQSGLVIQVTHVVVLYVLCACVLQILPCVRINDDDDDDDEYCLQMGKKWKINRFCYKIENALVLRGKARHGQIESRHKIACQCHMMMHITSLLCWDWCCCCCGMAEHVMELLCVICIVFSYYVNYLHSRDAVLLSWCIYMYFVYTRQARLYVCVIMSLYRWNKSVPSL